MPSTNDWIITSPGGGGWWTSIKIDQGTGRIYLCADLGGFYISDDWGNTWSTTGNDDTTAYSSITVPQTNIVLTGSNSGIHKSVDGGLTWTRKGVGQIYPAFGYTNWQSDVDTVVAIGNIQHNPYSPSIIYAGTGWTHDVDGVGTNSGPYGFKLFKSTDMGENWTNVTGTITRYENDGTLDCNAAGKFAFHPTDVNTVFIGTRKGLWKTTNGGSTWTKIHNSSIKSIAINPANANEAYMSTGYSNKLYKSINAQATTPTWTDITTNFPDYAVRADGAVTFTNLQYNPSGSIIYAGNRSTGYDIYYSSNGGSTWSYYPHPSSDTWRGSSANVCTMFDFSADRTKIFYCNPGNVFGSIDSGASFFNKTSYDAGNGYYKSKGHDVVEYFDMIVNPLNENEMMSFQWDSGACLSIDGGESWKTPSNFTIVGQFKEGYTGAYDPYNSGVIYAFRAYDNYADPAQLVKSIDSGETWTVHPTNLPVGNWRNLKFIAPNTMLASAWSPDAGDRNTYRTTNGGTTWTKVLTSYRVDDIQQSKSNPNIIYVAGMNRSDETVKGLHRSNDYGVTWFPTHTGTDLGSLTSIAIHPTNPDTIFITQASVGFFGNKEKPAGIYKSINGGASFTLVKGASDAFNAEHFRSVRFDPNDSNVLYACSMGKGTENDKNTGNFYVSEDGGATWGDFTKNLPPLNFFGITINSAGDIFAFTDGQGAYKLVYNGDPGDPNDPKVVNVSTNSIVISNLSSSTGQFNITSNTSWVISNVPSWIQLSQTSGSGNATITVTALSTNSSENDRSQYITITGSP